MKTVSNIITACLLVLAFKGVAGEVPATGFFRIIHVAVDVEESIQVRWQWQLLHANGYELGQRSGKISCMAGEHEVEVAAEGVAATKIGFGVLPGKVTTLLVGSSRDVGSERIRFRLHVLPPFERAKGHWFHGVSMLPKEQHVVLRLQLDGKGRRKRMELPGRGMERLELAGAQERVAIVSADGRLLGECHLGLPGNHVGVLYRGRKGRLQLLVYYEALP